LPLRKKGCLLYIKHTNKHIMKKQINITNPLTKEQLKNLKGGKNIWSNTSEATPGLEGWNTCCNTGTTPVEPTKKEK